MYNWIYILGGYRLFRFRVKVRIKIYFVLCIMSFDNIVVEEIYSKEFRIKYKNG